MKIHNASISAEREVDKICLRFKQATIEMQKKTIQELQKQLAAEQERANNAFELSLSNAKLAKERLNQLAAAQAAMKSAEALLHDYVVPADVRKFLLSGDTSALDATIASAKKPLVDALEAIKELSGPRSEAKRIAYAALAQVKEGK